MSINGHPISDYCGVILDWQMPFDRCSHLKPCPEHSTAAPSAGPTNTAWGIKGIQDWGKPDWLFVGDLSPRHQEALRIFVEKFRKGAQEHGDLQPGKEWTKDMLDEMGDLAFYAIFQLLEVGDHR